MENANFYDTPIIINLRPVQGYFSMRVNLASYQFLQLCHMTIDKW